MPLLFAAGALFRRAIYQAVPAGRTILADIETRPALALTMLAGMGAGVAGFVTGVLAIVKRKEKALLVYIAVAVGALLVWFLVGEILFPH